MIIMDIVFIFILTLILVSLLVPIGRYRTYHSYKPRVPASDEEPSSEGISAGLSMFFFFFVLFPLILAGSHWVGPYGPMFMGVSWVPILVIGFVLALLIAALSPREAGPVNRAEEETDVTATTGIAAVFGITYFILLFTAIALLLAAIAQ